MQVKYYILQKKVSLYKKYWPLVSGRLPFVVPIRQISSDPALIWQTDGQTDRGLIQHCLFVSAVAPDLYLGLHTSFHYRGLGGRGSLLLCRCFLPVIFVSTNYCGIWTLLSVNSWVMLHRQEAFSHKLGLPARCFQTRLQEIKVKGVESLLNIDKRNWKNTTRPNILWSRAETDLSGCRIVLS